MAFSAPVYAAQCKGVAFHLSVHKGDTPLKRKKVYRQYYHYHEGRLVSLRCDVHETQSSHREDHQVRSVFQKDRQCFHVPMPRNEVRRRESFLGRGLVHPLSALRFRRLESLRLGELYGEFQHEL
eukprot:TRINITY_DN3509_c0_g1_i11.p3 TRINITY_DN3509_c0_g1~~TRINITY_DN3509_c0_g1_i11.p3  ORF type:complete len:125 (-),score=2.68 TRINITY_DN3509_c0_g1_i11:427-801(-)